MWTFNKRECHLDMIWLFKSSFCSKQGRKNLFYGDNQYLPLPFPSNDDEVWQLVRPLLVHVHGAARGVRLEVLVLAPPGGQSGSKYGLVNTANCEKNRVLLQCSFCRLRHDWSWLGCNFKAWLLFLWSSQDRLMSLGRSRLRCKATWQGFTISFFLFVKGSHPVSSSPIWFFICASCFRMSSFNAPISVFNLVSSEVESLQDLRLFLGG